MYATQAKGQPPTLVQSTTAGMGKDSSGGLRNLQQSVDHCPADAIIEGTSLWQHLGGSSKNIVYVSANLNWQCDSCLSILFPSFVQTCIEWTQASGWHKKVGLSVFTKVIETWGSQSLWLKASVQIRSLWHEWHIPCPWEASLPQALSKTWWGVECLRTSDYACISGNLTGNCMHKQKPSG